MKKYAIIVAGGKGLRLGSELPKQFIPIGDKVILMYTIEAFYNYDNNIEIILVLPDSHKSYWKKLCQEYNFDIPHRMASGGETRFHSVKNGLALLSESGWVAIHDGVRPFVPHDVIEAAFAQALISQAAIPATDAIESLRKLCDNHSEAVDRNRYKMIQTPQVFDSEILNQAYNQPYSPLFTDDASVVEAMGIPVTLVNGSHENIKITTPFDLIVAQAIMNYRGIK